LWGRTVAGDSFFGNRGPLFHSYLFIVVWRLCVDIKKKMDYQGHFLKALSAKGVRETFDCRTLGKTFPTQRATWLTLSWIDQVGLCFEALIEFKRQPGKATVW